MQHGLAAGFDDKGGVHSGQHAALLGTTAAF